MLGFLILKYFKFCLDKTYFTSHMRKTQANDLILRTNRNKKPKLALKKIKNNLFVTKLYHYCKNVEVNTK